MLVSSFYSDQFMGFYWDSKVAIGTIIGQFIRNHGSKAVRAIPHRAIFGSDMFIDSCLIIFLCPLFLFTPTVQPSSPVLVTALAPGSSCQASFCALHLGRPRTRKTTPIPKLRHATWPTAPTVPC